VIVRAISVFVTPDAVEAFERVTVENRAGSIQEAGVLRFDVLRSAERPGEYLLYEVYADEKATAAHRETPHYKKWSESVAPMMARDRERAAYSVVAPADPSAW
jgi:autoinducer 2-degrading protein